MEPFANISFFGRSLACALGCSLHSEEKPKPGHPESDATTQKVAEAATHRFWGQGLFQASEPYFRGLVSTRAEAVQKGYEAASWGIQKAAVWALRGEGKKAALEEAQQKMERHGTDAPLKSFFGLLEAMLIPAVKKRIAEKQWAQAELIGDLIEVNLAKGFAHLAAQIQHLPPAGAPSLERLFQLFSSRFGNCLNPQLLADIEREYRQSYVDLERVSDELWPASGEEEKLRRQHLFQRYVRTDEVQEKQQILMTLFPELFPGDFVVEVDYDRDARVAREFLPLLESLSQRRLQLRGLFRTAADQLLLCLFPMKFGDMHLPRLLPERWAEWRYEPFVKKSLVDALYDGYEALGRDWPLVLEEYAVLEQTLNGYERADEWAALIGQTSERIVAEALEESGDWAETLKLGTLFSTHFPWAELSPELKTGLAEALCGLSRQPGALKQRLKQGVEVLLSAAVVNLARVSGEGRGAAPLLDGLRDFFSLGEDGKTILTALRVKQRQQEALRTKCEEIRSSLEEENRDPTLEELFDLSSDETLSQEVEALERRFAQALEPVVKGMWEKLEAFTDQQKGHWLIPPQLRDRIWPLLASPDTFIFLLNQAIPLWKTEADIPDKRDRLQKLSPAGAFLAQFAESASKELAARLPGLVDDRMKEIKKELAEGEELPLSVRWYDLAGLKQVLEGFVASEKDRTSVECYLEGTLLSLFLNRLESPLWKEQRGWKVLEATLKQRAEAGTAGRTPQEIQQEQARVIQALLKEGMGFSSPDDLESLPPLLREVVYEQLQTQLHTQLAPMMNAVTEQIEDRKRLGELARSPLFGKLCKLLALDVAEKVRTLPAEEAAELLPDAFAHVEGAPLGQALVAAWDPSALAGAIAIYAEGVLLKLFLRAAAKNRPEGGKTDALLVLTEKLLKKLEETYQALKSARNSEEEERLIHELKRFILEQGLGLESPKDLEGVPEGLKSLLYQLMDKQLGGLLLALHREAKGLEGSAPSVQKAKEGAKAFGVREGAEKSHLEILAEDLADLVMKGVARNVSEIHGSHFRGAHKASRGLESYVHDLARQNFHAAEALLEYSEGLSWQKLLEDHLGHLMEPEKFLEDKAKATEWLSHMLLIPLNEALGRVVKFEQERGAQFNRELMANLLQAAAGHLQNVHRARQGVEGKGAAQVRHEDYVEAVGSSLHPALPRTAPDYSAALAMIRKNVYGDWPHAQWEQYRERVRRKVAEWAEKDLQGREVLGNRELRKSLEEFHKKVTRKHLPHSVGEWLNRGLLKDQIRREADAPARQRLEGAHLPASKAVMKLLFPNGEQDLFYVAEGLRKQVWNLYEQQLLPVALVLLTESLLDPDALNSLVLSSLETLRESLRPLSELSIEELSALRGKGRLAWKKKGNGGDLAALSDDELQRLAAAGKIIAKPDEPEKDPTLDRLDEAAGELIAAALEMGALPDWANKLVREESGKVSPAMKKNVGALLRKQFHGEFLKEKLELMLEKVTRREDGDYLLRFDTASKQEKEARRAASRKQVEERLRSVSREVVDAGLSYYLRTQWEEAHGRFEAVIEQFLGETGLQLKEALDAVFGHLFFEVGGAFLSFLFSPFKEWVKEKLYAAISLDENRIRLMEMWTTVPEQQPIDENYALYHEELLFKMGQAVHQTVEQVLKKGEEASSGPPSALPEGVVPEGGRGTTAGTE